MIAFVNFGQLAGAPFVNFGLVPGCCGFEIRDSISRRSTHFNASMHRGVGAVEDSAWAALF